MGRRKFLSLVCSVALALVSGVVSTPAFAAAPVRIMAIGDSITAGDDGDYTWRYRLWQHLSQNGADVDFVGDFTAPRAGSYGASGWDSDHQAVWGRPAWVQKQETAAAVTRHTPDLVVLHIGTNDLAYGGEAAVAASDVGAIIAAARSARPSVKFLLMKVIPRDGTDQTVTQDYNARLAALAAGSSTAASPIAVGDAYTGVDPDDDLYDGTHPNRRGEYKIAAAVARGLWSSYGIGANYPTIPDVATGPDTPAGVTARAGDGEATISWSAVRTATSYNVYARDRTAGETSFQQVQFGVTSTSWTQTILWNGHEYEYRVAAVRWFDESPMSSPVKVTPAAPRPASPTGVQTTTSRNTVTVSWNAVSGAETYSVYARDVTAGAQFRQVQFNVTGTSWTQTLLTSGHVYEYYVTAVRRGMESAPSADSQVEVQPAPDDPADVRATAGDGRVTVRWSPVAGATSYRVYGRDATAGAGFSLVQWDLTASQWTQTILINGHRYEYYVTAVNGGSESGRSVIVAATPHATPPAAPGNLRASASGASITLNWNAVSGVSNYTVYARDRTAGESSYQKVQWNLSATTWTHRLLTPGHVYEYFVTAVTSVEGDGSNTVRLMAGGPRPSAPSSLTATPGSHSVKLVWSAVSGAESYTVYGRDVTAGGAWRSVQWGLTGTTWTQTILVDGHTYAYYVRAVRGGLESSASPVDSAVPFTPPPPAPKWVTASAGNGTITVSWAPVSGAASYTVYLKISGQFNSWQPYQWGLTGTSWTQTLVDPYYKHNYYVTAIKDGQASEPSPVASAVWVAPKPYKCNYITQGKPNRIGTDSKGTLSFQYNYWATGERSMAWGFKLSPALITLGDNGRAPAETVAWFTHNGRLDPNNHVDLGERVDYHFHGRYRGMGAGGIDPGDEVRLEVGVTFQYSHGPFRGTAVVKASDCYQIIPS